MYFWWPLLKYISTSPICGKYGVFLGIVSLSHWEGMKASPTSPPGNCFKNIFSRPFLAAWRLFFFFLPVGEDLFLDTASLREERPALSDGASFDPWSWSEPQSECSDDTSVVELSAEKSLSSREQSLVASESSFWLLASLPSSSSSSSSSSDTLRRKYNYCWD